MKFSIASLKTTFALATTGLAFASPLASQTVTAPTSFISNGDFQTDENKDGTPEGWGAPKGPLSYEMEGENRFARLTSEKPGQMALLYRLISIPEGQKALELSWKQRISNLKPGKNSWFDARIMMEWKDAEGKKMKGAPSAPYTRKDSDWVEKTITYLVHEGARTLEFMPSKYQFESRTFAIHNIVLSPA
ncbi:MAG: hypothetical protein KY445_13295, partial [Armatimonadetes bacterium]|nr:hypothetical protein [Armatimonadota bacterium]